MVDVERLENVDPRWPGPAKVIREPRLRRYNAKGFAVHVQPNCRCTPTTIRMPAPR